MAVRVGGRNDVLLPAGDASFTGRGYGPRFFYSQAMSAELIDMRLKITPETNQVLEAINRSSGMDKNEIARQWLHDLALKKIDEATLFTRLTRGEGVGSA